MTMMEAEDRRTHGQAAEQPRGPDEAAEATTEKDPDAVGTIVVKIGGSTLGSHDTTLKDLVALQSRGIQPIVVHGGGKTISEWMERQGVRPEVRPRPAGDGRAQPRHRGGRAVRRGQQGHRGVDPGAERAGGWTVGSRWWYAARRGHGPGAGARRQRGGSRSPACPRRDRSRFHAGHSPRGIAEPRGPANTGVRC